MSEPVIISKSKNLNAKAFLIIGKKGSGKTYSVLKLLKIYVERRKMPVVIIDQTGEYSNFGKLDYNPNEPDEARRINGKLKQVNQFKIIERKNILGKLEKFKVPLSENVVKSGIAGISKTIPAIYQINVTTFDREQKLRLIEDLGNHFKNGLLVAEEMNSYIRRQVPESFYSFLTRLRHNGVDFCGLYQALGDPHPDVYRQIEFIQLFKAQDSVLRQTTADKITGGKVELVEIAEIAIDIIYKDGSIPREEIKRVKFERQNKEENKINSILAKYKTNLNYLFFFVYINFENDSIFTVPDDVKNRAVNEFINRHQNEVKSLLNRVNESGAKLYQTFEQARQAIFNEKMLYFK